jgi:CheY-like chemotaxis protein/DNA-binding CsgD family transcriptional regulator
MGGKSSIVIVDDSPTAISLMKLYLVNLGYAVTGTADTAGSALQLVHHEPPDLVLMDINLGEGMSGIDAADIIMNRYGIPVIYVTAYSDDSTLDSAKRSMPYGFINKPFRDNDLRVNIEVALARSALSKKPGGNLPPRLPERIDDVPDVDQSILSEVLDHLVSGILMVNEHLQVLYNNKSAVKILADTPMLKMKDQQLICSSTRTKRDLQKPIAGRETVIMTLKHEQKDLHLLLFPLAAPGYANNNAGSVLFLFETLHDAARIEEVVRTMYKLSPTEARIASQLVFNPNLPDISVALGITYNTTRTHLKHIYQKTGTNKLPSLIQKIVTGPAGLLIHSMD